MPRFSGPAAPDLSGRCGGARELSGVPHVVRYVERGVHAEVVEGDRPATENPARTRRTLGRNSGAERGAQVRLDGRLPLGGIDLRVPVESDQDRLRPGRTRFGQRGRTRRSECRAPADLRAARRCRPRPARARGSLLGVSLGGARIAAVEEGHAPLPKSQLRLRDDPDRLLGGEPCRLDGEAEQPVRLLAVDRNRQGRGDECGNGDREQRSDPVTPRSAAFTRSVNPVPTILLHGHH